MIPPIRYPVIRRIGVRLDKEVRAVPQTQDHILRNIRDMDRIIHSQHAHVHKSLPAKVLRTDGINAFIRTHDIVKHQTPSRSPQIFVAFKPAYRGIGFHTINDLLADTQGIPP